MKTKSTTRRDFIAQSMLTAVGLSIALPTLGESIPPMSLEDKMKSTIRPPEKAAGKVSIFSKNLHWLNYPDMAAVAAQLGFDGVDLTVRPDGHVVPEKVGEDLPKAVEAIRKAGMDVFMITTAISDPDHPHTEAIIKTAGQLGIGHYRMGWFPYQDNLSVTRNLEAFKVSMGKLAKLNKKYNVHGDYQNHSGTSLGGSLWDLWMVIKDMDPQWIGCQYDIRHATVEGANSWPIAMKLLQTHIRTLDIKDFHWASKEGKWQVENVPLGQGMVDFKKYFELLRLYKLTGPFSIHYEYPLGGAENGAKQLTMNKEEVLTAMQKDLATLRGWLKGVGN